MFWMRHKLPTPLEGFRHRTDLLDQGVDQNHLFFLVFRSDGCFCFCFCFAFFCFDQEDESEVSIQLSLG